MFRERKRGRVGLHAVLLGCSALVAVVPTGLMAQQDTTMLSPIMIEGIAGDDDRRSIVATRSTAGSKMEADILDIPASISVITSREIQRRGADTVEQVLQYSAGVVTDMYGSDDRFDIFKVRGLDAYTYRDGLTLGRAFGSVREEAYAFERVEVIRGANSTAFGISDPGGMVNYVTKRPRDERFGEVYATGGSFNRAEVGFDFGDRLNSDGSLTWRLTGKLRDADGEYDHSRDDQKFLMGGLTWRPDDATSLTLVVDHLDSDGVPTSGGHPMGLDFDRETFFGEPDFFYRSVERSTASLMFEHDFGGGLSFSSNARYSDADTGQGYAYISATPTDGSTLAERSFIRNSGWARTFIADARLQYDTQFQGIASRTLVGIEYRDARSESESFYGASSTGVGEGIDWTNPIYTGVPDVIPQTGHSRSDQETKSVYVQQELTFERLIASAGIRHDWIDTTQTNLMAGTADSGDVSETTGRFALTYKITPEISAFASYAESVVPAALTVEPERGKQYELGVKYQPAGSNTLLTAAIYDLTKHNITRTNPQTQLPETIGEVRVRGLDIEAKAELADNISLTAAYAYMDSEVVESGTTGINGNRLSLVPKHVASVWVDYTLAGNGTRGDMTFGLGARFNGQLYAEDANNFSIGGNTIFDAAYSYQVNDNTELSLNVSNLFDREYVAYTGWGADFYNPGREVSATLRRTW